MWFMREWYIFLSQLSASVGDPLRQFSDRIEFPLVTALLFGLMGATAPCQLTTNLSAIAYVSRRLGEGRPWVEAMAYTLGKVLMYTVAGGAVIGLGLQIQVSTVPVVVVARKILGPLLIVIGLAFLGLFSLRITLGQKLTRAVQSRISLRGAWGAFLMGIVFSFAFCPTLFLLFFGLTVPLGLRSTAGFLFPGLFAVGTALPLLVYAGLVAAGSGMAGAYAGRLARGHSAVRRIAGVIFILAGINDTLTYWSL
jgi:cytochrome c biogenesis protein CcdA